MLISNFVLSEVKIILVIYISLSQCPLTIGLKLAYDKIEPPGRDQGQDLAPIIMMHGKLSWRKEWKYVAPDIANNTGRTVYAVDARNHGDSPWSNEHTYEVMTDDLDEFLSDNNLTKAIFIGLSMGGKIITTYALKRPEKVEKLVVEDMKVDNITREEYEYVCNFHFLYKSLLKKLTEVADIQKARERISRRVGAAVKHLFKTEHLDWDLLPIKEEGKTYVGRTNIDVILNLSYEEVLAGIYSGIYNGEALFIYGNKSRFNVANDKKIKEYFPRAKLVEWNTGQHALHLRFPERFIQVVSDFINNKNDTSEL